MVHIEHSDQLNLRGSLDTNVDVEHNSEAELFEKNAQDLETFAKTAGVVGTIAGVLGQAPIAKALGLVAAIATIQAGIDKKYAQSIRARQREANRRWANAQQIREKFQSDFDKGREKGELKDTSTDGDTKYDSGVQDQIRTYLGTKQTQYA